MAASPDSELTDRIFRLGDELVRIVVLSFLTTALSLPVVTAPAAMTAAFGTFHHQAGTPRSGYVQPFFTLFVRALRGVTVRGLLLLAALSVFSLNIVLYAGHPEPGALWAMGAVIQVVAALAVLAVALRYVDGAARFLLHDGAGRPAGLRSAVSAVRRSPMVALAATAVVLVVPAALVWLSLWQFSLLVLGAQAYLAVRVLRWGDGRAHEG